MRFGERFVLFFVRPIYRTFFERLLWWFLARIKVFFLSEIGTQLGNVERRFQAEDAANEQRWAALEARLRSIEVKNEERVRSAEAANVAQWNAIEQLLLALFRQPVSHRAALDLEDSGPRNEARGEGAELSRAHAANNIR